MRLRFSIRDVLWLTLVVAMGLGWFAREQQFAPRMRQLEDNAKAWEDTAREWENSVAFFPVKVTGSSQPDDNLSN